MPQALHVLRITTVLALLAGIAISLPLWTNGEWRAFPVLPTRFGLPAIPAPFDGIRLALLVGALFGQAFMPRVRAFGWGVLAMAAWMLAEDHARWQPWPYQYLLMLAPFVLFPAAAGSGSIVFYQRALIATVYFWSGVHKLGDGFYRLFDRTLAPGLIESLGDSFAGWLLRAAVHSAGPLEIALAALLLMPRTRRPAVVVAVLIHAGILVWFALDSRNVVVWPWNMAMIVFAIALFWSKEERGESSRNAEPPAFRAAFAGLAACVALLPALWYAGAWPTYFSFHLYSGKTQRMVITFTSEEAFAKLPQRYHRFGYAPEQDPRFREIGVTAWSSGAMRVPIPPDDRALLELAKHVARETGLSSQSMYFYRDYPFFLEERGWAIYPPEEILHMRSLPPIPAPNPEEGPEFP